jgi:hypothetical protein
MNHVIYCENENILFNFMKSLSSAHHDEDIFVRTLFSRGVTGVYLSLIEFRDECLFFIENSSMGVHMPIGDMLHTQEIM